VANTLDAFRNGAVGFIDWLDLFFQKQDHCAQVRAPQLTSLPTSSCIKGDFGHECTPFWTKATAIQQDSWALFEPLVAAVTVADPAPVHMRDNMIERDIILAHQSGCELRSAVDGAAKIVAPVYTHFDPDGRPVSLALVISMLSSFIGRQALVNGMIIHSEMPSEKSSTIVTTSEPFLHGECVMQCVGATRSIVSGMNSDKCRTHRSMQGTSAFPWGNDVLRDFQFGRAGGRHAPDGDASGSRHTGRKEKPYQDNGKNPKCAKFHSREVNLTTPR
jgi:hypothetical protein